MLGPILWCLAILWAYALSTPQSTGNEGPVNVWFFSTTRAETGQLQFSRSTDVPYCPGRNGYGWAATINSSNEVLVTETLILPKPAIIWPKDMEVTDNGRVGTRSLSRTPKENKLYGFWRVVDGDPIGEYELKVSLDSVVSHFRFRVIPELGLQAGCERISHYRSRRPDLLTALVGTTPR